MDPDKQNAHRTPLPNGLSDQLEDFRKNLWRGKIVEAVLAGFFGLLFSYLLVFILDRFIETPAVLRLGILISGISLFAIFVPLLLRRWVWGHRQDRQIARLIAKKFPGLGDRLLGVVELRSQSESETSLSPALRDAAMRNVAAEAKDRDLEQALPASLRKRWGSIVIALFVLSLGSLVFAPQASLNALQRWLFPFADTPRFTYTELENLPETLTVPYGESTTFKVTLTRGSVQVPDSATVKFDGRDPISTSLDGERSYSFKLPGQRAITFMTINVGDVSQRVRVEPVVRPSLESLAAVITPPQYLGQTPREIDINTGYLSIVEGSSISIKGSADRQLVSISAGPVKASSFESEDQAPAEFEGAWKSGSYSLSLDQREFTFPDLTVANRSFDLPLSWTDIHGLEGKGQFSLTVEPVPDAAPVAYMQGVERQVIILAEETVEFNSLCEDDWGLKEIGIEWLGQHTRPTDEAPAEGELKLESYDNSPRRISLPTSFSPKAYGITPQRLALRVYVTDHYPDRARSYSQPITIHILTRQEHAQLLHNQFGRLLSALEDSARREQDQLDTNDLLNRKKAEELQDEETLRQLLDQAAKEEDSERKMKELSEQMDKLFKDALRNGEIEKENMKRLAETAKSLRDLAEKDIPKVGEKLKESTDQRNTPEKSKEDLNKAVEEQKKALAKMKKTIEEANETNKRLEAGTFITRLKRAAGDEKGIVSSLTEDINSTIGREFSDINLSKQSRLKDIATQQSVVASDVRWIREDLMSFFARTSKEEHQSLFQAMQDSGIDSGLNTLSQQIAENLSFRSITDADKWAKQLSEWAKMLEGDKSGNNGGGGGGEGGGQQGDQDFEFMLKVMKMIQAEQDIRARTRSLEQLRRSIELDTPKATNP